MALLKRRTAPLSASFLSVATETMIVCSADSLFSPTEVMIMQATTLGISGTRFSARIWQSSW